MKPAINYREDEIQRILHVYASMTEHVAGSLKSCVSKLQNVCEQTHYTVVISATNDIITFYNEEVSRIVQNKFREWAEGDQSPVAYINRLNGGEAACQTARNLVNRLEEQLLTLFTPRFEPVSVDTSDPKVDETAYTSMGEAASKLCGQIEEQKSSTLNKVRSHGEENTLYLCLQSVVIATCDGILSGFQGFSGNTKKLTEDFLSQQSNIRSAAEAGASQASAVAGQVEDAFSQIGSGFPL